MAARIRANPPSLLAPSRRNHDCEPLVTPPTSEAANGSDFGCDHGEPQAYDNDEEFRQQRRRRRRGAGSPTTPPSMPESSSVEMLRRQLVRTVASSACRAVASGLIPMTRLECAALLVVVTVTSAVAGLVQASIHGRVVPWQIAGIIMLTLILFVKDQKRASTRFVVPWLALLLLVATPVLSGSSVLVMAVMVALPLQLIIHRFRQAVTLEACKVPPLARVKSIDVRNNHPDDRSSLVSLAFYTGHVVLWRAPHAPSTTATTATTSATEMARGLEVCRQQPLRSVRFYAHRSSSELDRRPLSVLAAGDDGRLVQVDGETLTVVERSVQAHSDFCRCVEVHPTLPVVFTSSDDGSIKLWDAAAGSSPFVLKQVLEGHDDFVMVIKIHPDGKSLVTASMDTTILKWTLESSAYDVTVPSSAPSLTFRGHSEGVNCLDFVVRGDDAASNVLVSGSDDLSIKLWDYASGALIRSISHAHQDNINAILVHPHLPIMISACEGGVCHVWNVPDGAEADISLQDTWNLNKGRAWALAWVGSEQVAIGFDQGCGIVRMQSESGRADNGDHPSGASNLCAQSRWLSRVEFVSSGDT